MKNKDISNNKILPTIINHKKNRLQLPKEKKTYNWVNILDNNSKKELNTKIDNILNKMLLDKKQNKYLKMFEMIDKNNKLPPLKIENFSENQDDKDSRLNKNVFNPFLTFPNNIELNKKEPEKEPENINIEKCEENMDNNNKQMVPVEPTKNILDRDELLNIFKNYGKTYDHIYYNPLFEATENVSILKNMIEKKEKEAIVKKKVNIEAYIETLDDLLKLIEEYPLDEAIEYNIDMKGLHNIKEPLNDLHNMIGMKELKNSVVDQILYFIQELHKGETKMSNDFMHTVIYGPPGTGKTELAKIIGKVFSKLGILKNNVFKKATRADMIAGYLGQTAIKTKELIKDCLGGVLFIDEAYALGNMEKRDSFAKECIDTLCECLSDNKENLMVIIAGYEQELEKCFFAYNQGLDSRFTWRFKTDDYSADELKQIFTKKIKDAGWTCEDLPSESWFEKNKKYFKYFGRDMETLFAKTKIAHSRRIFGKDKDLKRKVNKKDVKKGLELYLKNEEVKKRGENKDDFPLLSTMYN